MNQDSTMDQKKDQDSYKFIEQKDNICRTCLSDNDSLISVFEIDSSLHATYSNIIFSITGLEIKQDLYLPTSICSTCKTDIILAHRYKEKAIRADEKLRDIYRCNNRSDEASPPMNSDDGGKYFKQLLEFEIKPKIICDEESKNNLFSSSVESANDGYSTGNIEKTFATPVKTELVLPLEYDDSGSDRDNSASLPSFHLDKLYDGYHEDEKDIFMAPEQRAMYESQQSNYTKTSTLHPHSVVCVKVEHLTEKRNYCPVCGACFDTAVELVRHALLHDSLLSDSGVKADSMSWFDMRSLSKHNGAQGFKVKKKKHSYTSKSKMADAQNGGTETHTYEMEDANYANDEGECGDLDSVVPKYPHCGICSLKFKTRRKLENHFRAHSNTTVMICVCGKFFLEQMYFKRHLAKWHRGDLLTLESMRTISIRGLVVSRGETFSNVGLYLSLCQHCGQLTLSAEELKDHNTTEHPRLDRKLSLHRKLNKDRSERSHKCSICAKTFRLAQHMLCHVKNKHDPKRLQHECYICGKKFDKSDQLEKHKYRSHRPQSEDGKRFRCDQCDYKCFEKYNLVTHVKIHSGVKAKPVTVVCPYCGKEIVKKEMPAHIRRLHTLLKPYKCRFCDKAFVRGGDRNEHERIHTGHKPYACEICGLKSTKSLAVHKRIHTGERPHRCSYCGQGFTQKSDMRAHERRHTGESAYSCDVCGKAFTHAKYLREHKTTCQTE